MISPISFGQLIIETGGMGKIAKKQAEALYSDLLYYDEVDKLDRQKHVDIVIIKDRDNAEDRAKVAFMTPDDKLYKIDGRDHIKTMKRSVFGPDGQKTEYGTNVEKVIEAAQAILKGENTKTTTKPTNTFHDIKKEIPMRSNQFYA